jgi:hypothetical protein
VRCRHQNTVCLRNSHEKCCANSHDSLDFNVDFDEYIFYNDFIAVAEIGMVADSGSGMIKKSSSAFYYFLLFDFLDIFLFLLLFFNLPSSFQRVLSSRNGPNCNPNHPQAGSGWGTVNIAES